MYENLTKYLTEFPGDKIGTWVVDKDNGAPGHPFIEPYVDHTGVVENFIKDVYVFVEEHKEMGLKNYFDILEANGIEGRMDSSTIEKLDAKCTLALILRAIRADRFCDGALLGAFESGSMMRWLERLKALDANEGDRNAT